MLVEHINLVGRYEIALAEPILRGDYRPFKRAVADGRGARSDRVFCTNPWWTSQHRISEISTVLGISHATLLQPTPIRGAAATRTRLVVYGVARRR